MVDVEEVVPVADVRLAVEADEEEDDADALIAAFAVALD